MGLTRRRSCWGLTQPTTVSPLPAFSPPLPRLPAPGDGPPSHGGRDPPQSRAALGPVSPDGVQACGEAVPGARPAFLKGGARGVQADPRGTEGTL